MLRKEISRLTAENNQLHVNIINESESCKVKEREHYQNLKSLECEIAELAYWKNCTLKKLKELETQNEEMKTKLEKGVIPDVATEANLDMTAALERKDKTEPPTAAETINLDIVRTADARYIFSLLCLLINTQNRARITELEDTVKQSIGEIQNLKDENVHLLVCQES